MKRKMIAYISKAEISLNTTFDTLEFGTSIGTAQFSTIYKRVNN